MLKTLSCLLHYDIFSYYQYCHHRYCIGYIIYIYIYYIYVYLYIVYENKIVENPSESTTGRPMSRRAPLRHPMPRLAQTAASALILMETIEQRLGY